MPATAGTSSATSTSSCREGRGPPRVRPAGEPARRGSRRSTARRRQVLVDVELASVTFVETQLRAGHPPHPAMAPELPAVLGNGVGGVVSAVGDGVDATLVGRRVVTTTGGRGGYAQRAVADAGSAHRGPRRPRAGRRGRAARRRPHRAHAVRSRERRARRDRARRGRGGRRRQPARAARRGRGRARRGRGQRRAQGQARARPRRGPRRRLRAARLGARRRPRRRRVRRRRRRDRARGLRARPHGRALLELRHGERDVRRHLDKTSPPTPASRCCAATASRRSSCGR